MEKRKVLAKVGSTFYSFKGESFLEWLILDKVFKFGPETYDSQCPTMRISLINQTNMLNFHIYRETKNQTRFIDFSSNCL